MSIPDRFPPGGFRSPQPFEGERIRAAAIYCSDGRIGEQVDDFLHQSLILPRYDRVAVPGGPASLAGHFAVYRQEASLLEQISFLIEVHGLARVVLIAHEGCAFYTQALHVREIDLLDRQCVDLERAARRILQIDRRLQVDGYFARLRHNHLHFLPLEEARSGHAGGSTQVRPD